MGRNREKHQRMPKGWAPSAGGVIYFRPTNAEDRAIVQAITGGPLSLRLGATHDEAAQAYARLIIAARTHREEVTPGTVGEIIHRAREKWLQKIKNEETRAWRSAHLDELEREFGKRRYARNVYDATKAAPGTYLVAMDVQAWLDRNASTRPVAANRAAQSGRIVWKEARRRWGLTEYNPFEGLEANEEAPREAVPDDAMLFRVMRELTPPGRFLLALGRYYGRRPGEGLRVDITGIDHEGLHTVRGKRARELILEWDDVVVGEAPDGTPITRPGRLRKMVARAMRWRESVIRPTKVWKNGKRPKAPATVALALLVNRRGRRVTRSGYLTEFRKAMARLGLVEQLGEGMIGGRKVMRTRRAFNVNDTRAKRASTLPKGHATEVLAHDEQRTTESIYRRGPIRIRVKEER